MKNGFDRFIMALLAVLVMGNVICVNAAISKDSAASQGGSNEVRTFTKKTTLPGGINIEFSLVTLAKYEKDVNNVFDYTFSEVKRVAGMLSGDSPELKEVAEKAGKEPVKVSKEVYALASLAKEIADWSHGAFDPVRGGGSYKNLKLDKDGQTIFLTKAGLSLDLSEILRGFIADLCIRAAYHANVDDAFVEVDSVRRSMGKASYGPWQIRLTGNGNTNARHGMDVVISNYSAATVGGQFAAPTIDRRRGKPINDEKLDSVTILTEKAAMAEGLANAVYALGHGAGETLVKDLGIKAVFGYKDGTFERIGSW